MQETVTDEGPTPIATEPKEDFDVVRGEFIKHGFILEETGGGCRAFIRWQEGSSIWVTRGEDPDVPESLNDEAVTVGFYGPDDGEFAPIAYVHYPNALAALDAIGYPASLADKVRCRVLEDAHRLRVMLPENIL